MKIKRIITTIISAALIMGSLSGCGQAYEIACPAVTAEPTKKVEVTPMPNVKIDDLVKSQVLSKAEYPEQAKYPEQNSENYWNEYEAWIKNFNSDREVIYKEEMEHFFNKLAPLMNELNAGENVVYSPMNLWFALSLLAETTAGNTKNQILSVLGTDADNLVATANNMWINNYRDDGLVTSTLGNSIWLRNDTTYVKETVEKLAKDYYASSFAGDMGSKEYSAELQKWLNENTGNLLQNEASQIEFKNDVAFALASTIYFKAPWREEFNKFRTEKKTFHGASSDKEIDFLNRKDEGVLYYGKGFTAYRKPFAEQGGGMWFILPDEGTTPEKMISEGKYTKLLFGDTIDLQYFRGDINLSVPKFDVSYMTDVKDVFTEMGITDVVIPGKADFNPIIGKNSDIALSEALHAARVKIDEEGVEAAAFTVMMMKNTAIMQTKEVDFVLDRPFVFIVTNRDNVPTFVGTVNNPE